MCLWTDTAYLALTEGVSMEASLPSENARLLRSLWTLGTLRRFHLCQSDRTDVSSLNWLFCNYELHYLFIDLLATWILMWSACSFPLPKFSLGCSLYIFFFVRTLCLWNKLALCSMCSKHLSRFAIYLLALLMLISYWFFRKYKTVLHKAISYVNTCCEVRGQSLCLQNGERE